MRKFIINNISSILSLLRLSVFIIVDECGLNFYQSALVASIGLLLSMIYFDIKNNYFKLKYIPGYAPTLGAVAGSLAGTIIPNQYIFTALLISGFAFYIFARLRNLSI